MSVITTFEFHNVLTLGISARQPNGGHSRFCAGAYEAHFLYMRKCGKHNLSQVSLAGRRSSEAGAIAGSVHNGFDHFGGSMSENKRAPRADVVDVLVAIRVENMRTLTAHNERSVSTHRTESAYRRIDPSWNHLLGALLQLARNLYFAGHGLSDKETGDLC